MSRRRPVLLTSVAFAFVASACASPPATDLEVAPAGVPVPIEDVTPAQEVPVPDEPAVVEEAPAEPPAPPAPEPVAPGTSAEPAPDLVVGEDGCVTDLTTGLVITCHDEAAGPDEPVEGDAP